MKLSKGKIFQIKKMTLSSLMRMSPYALTDTTIFKNDKKSEKIFFDNLYYESNSSLKLKEQIKREIEANSNRQILLYGYSGCGKTTFIHSLLHDKSNLKVIDFEQSSCVQSNTPIENKIIHEIASKISFTKNKNFVDIQKLYLFVQKKYDIISQVLDNENCIYKTIERINNKISKKKVIEHIEFHKFLIKILSKLDLVQLLSLDFLIELENVFSTKKKKIICFDNLDIIIEAEHLNRFLTSFSIFHINANRFVNTIGNPHFPNIGSAFTYIITLRETTKAKVAPHYEEHIAWNTIVFDLSIIYEKEKIIKKRSNFLKELDCLSEEQVKALYAIEMFTNNKYMNKYFFDLFNQNFRYAINTIEELANNNREKIQLFNQLCAFENRNYYMVANGIFMKMLLNQFNSEGIFNNELKLLSLFGNSSTKKVSISRMILTYLSNIDETESCSLGDILSAFDGIFTYDDILSIINSLYEMKNGKWRHLITFSSCSKYSLTEQVEKYKNKETGDGIYSFIKITNAGKTFLKTISVSFEFYSSRLITRRIYGKQSIHEMPLIMPENMNKIAIGKNNNYKYKFDLMIKDVFKSVETCFNRLNDFDQELINSKSIENYCTSKYVFKKANIGYLHKERIVFSQIGYINSFRLYVLNELQYKNEEKKEINKILVDYLDSYLKLVERLPESERSVSTSVYVSLRKQIKLIINSKYEDFSTKIETSNYYSNQY